MVMYHYNICILRAPRFSPGVGGCLAGRRPLGYRCGHFAIFGMQFRQTTALLAPLPPGGHHYHIIRVVLLPLVPCMSAPWGACCDHVRRIVRCIFHLSIAGHSDGIRGARTSALAGAAMGPPLASSGAALAVPPSTRSSTAARRWLQVGASAVSPGRGEDARQI